MVVGILADTTAEYRISVSNTGDIEPANDSEVFPEKTRTTNRNVPCWNDRKEII